MVSQWYVELSHFHFNGLATFPKKRVTKPHCRWRCVPIVSINKIKTKEILINSQYFIVDAEEIKRLGKRFRKLDLDNSGSLSIDEFMSLPELQQNPLVQRVIDIFDTDRNGEVDFKGLIQNKTFFPIMILIIIYF